MKTIVKMFAVLVLFLFATETQSQTRMNQVCTFMSNQIIEKVDGFIADNVITDNGSTLTYVGIPDYYDFDLVRMSIKNLIDGYSDIRVVSPWSLKDGKYSIGLSISDSKTKDDYAMLIVYYPDYDEIVIAHK